ncbi:MAG: hypothetical protein Q9208_001456 [Pyrenodesmia sp. 3 TL-2023]
MFPNPFDRQGQEFAPPHPAPEFAPLPGQVPMAVDSAHGDRVAALAVGDRVGVANRANLVAVKRWAHPRLDPATGAPLQDEFWHDIYGSWAWILNDVRTKNPSRVGKAVINFSGAENELGTILNLEHIDYARWGIFQPESHDFWLPLLVDAWTADIVTVFAAGNRKRSEPDSYHIGTRSPQRFASQSNPIINVGSVNRLGQASGFNALVGAGPYARGRDVLLTGETTVYAMGEKVVNLVPGTYGDYSDTKSGTSYAAPQIAGLAAYFLTLPGLEEAWRPGHVAQDMKNFIKGHMRLPPRSPDGALVAYNGVEDLIPFCDRPGPNVRAKPRSIFSLATIVDHVANIFKRQKEGLEIVIFEHGMFTDPKYSEQNLPQSSWLDFQHASQAMDRQIIQHDFLREYPQPYILPATMGPGRLRNDWKIKEAALAPHKTSLLRLESTPNEDTPFNKTICSAAFTAAMDNCDKDRTSKFGGECDVNNVHFKAYASPARDVPEDATIGDKKQPLPVARWNCYEPAVDPFAAPFRRAAMTTHIDDTCRDFPTWAGGNHTKIASNDPNVLLQISTNPLKRETPFLESDCVKGYNIIILDRCNTETDQNWGGNVNVGDVWFEAYARRLEPVASHTCFTTQHLQGKLKDNKNYNPFNRQDMRNFIEKTCGDNAGTGSKGWKFDTPYVSTDKPYLTMRTGKFPKNSEHLGFDKDICFRGFNAVMEQCGLLKGDPDDKQTYGGQVKIDDITYTIFNKKTT